MVTGAFDIETARYLNIDSTWHQSLYLCFIWLKPQVNGKRAGQ